jgi:hypothetical protein
MFAFERDGREMALKVEGVVDGGLHAEKTLGSAECPTDMIGMRTGKVLI